MTEDICANCRHLLVPADQRSSIIYEQEPKYTCHVYQHTGAKYAGNHPACPQFAGVYIKPKLTCGMCHHIECAGLAYRYNRYDTGANPGDSFECCGFKPKE